MASGPGKYDDLCTFVRVTAGARGAIVMIFHGNDRSGFSVQADPETLAVLPAMLRDMANEMEGDIRRDLGDDDERRG